MIDNNALLQEIRNIVGANFVLTDTKATRQYRKGYRFGDGKILAVVRPKTLLEQWKILKILVENDKIIIMQAANTGLTGGSTPDGNNYDRDIVIINTMRQSEIQILGNGEQVVCMPGATLDRLEQILKPFGREPHSVIGSSCIGASVHGGVCNNSGGALVRRGPAYTELALFAKVNSDGQLELVNHLGIYLGSSPEDILTRLQERNYGTNDVDFNTEKAASDKFYCEHVRQIDADTPARFNADPSRHYEASGSAGKLSVFAVRLDTFPTEPSDVFYVGTNDTNDLTNIRRHLLQNSKELPIAGEYIHQKAFEIGEKYGKDSFLLIDKMGTQKVPAAFAFKSKIDGIFENFGLKGLSDKIIQIIMNLLPSHLPKQIKDFGNRFEHHLLLRIAKKDAEFTKNYLEEYFKNSQGEYFECDADTGRKAFLLRFAVAGAAIRYRETHNKEVEDIVALDIALRRNDNDWLETLPAEIDDKIIEKLYYGHFFCHVFHQDYIIKKGHDPIAIEHKMWDLLDERGAQYPAEHNFGHLYKAKKELRDFYKSLDPTNSFNPGIGQTTKLKNWSQK
jgi:D-lactate dehydrogenase (quinone)